MSISILYANNNLNKGLARRGGTTLKMEALVPDIGAFIPGCNRMAHDTMHQHSALLRSNAPNKSASAPILGPLSNLLLSLG